MSNADSSATPAVKSAERVLALLERLARASTPTTLSELQRDLDIPKSSLHALVTTMLRTGWAAQRDGGYTLGPVSRMLGSTPTDDVDIVELGAGALTSLRDEVQETVHLATLDGPEILYLASRSSPHALGVRFHAGRRLPAQITALGKAMLAQCTHDALTEHLPEEYITPTKRSVSSEAELRIALEEVRRRGYAIDDEETAAGLRCFAIALASPSLPLYAISCSAPVARLDTDRERHIVDALIRTRDTLLGQVGHRAS